MSRAVIRSTSTLWTFLLISTYLVDYCNASFSLTMVPEDERCFIIRTPAALVSTITGTFDCLDDDADGTEFSVTMTNYHTQEMLYQKPKDAREGSFQIGKDKIKPSTKYSLCFQNKNDDDDKENEIDIGFSFRVVNAVPRTLEEGELGPDNERALKLVEKASAIHEDWTNMMDHLDFVRNREAMHSEMHNAILSRLSRWTYLEALVVIGMATAQVMYWKKFFETKRYL